MQALLGTFQIASLSTPGTMRPPENSLYSAYQYFNQKYHIRVYNRGNDHLTCYAGKLFDPTIYPTSVDLLIYLSIIANSHSGVLA